MHGIFAVFKGGAGNFTVDSRLEFAKRLRCCCDFCYCFSKGMGSVPDKTFNDVSEERNACAADDTRDCVPDEIINCAPEDCNSGVADDCNDCVAKEGHEFNTG